VIFLHTAFIKIKKCLIEYNKANRENGKKVMKRGNNELFKKGALRVSQKNLSFNNDLLKI
jgi:hypothetical protein